jgi:hypothetical protein
MKTLRDYINLIESAEKGVAQMQVPTDNQYPVYPEDDGTDRPRNPYSPV